MSDKRCGILSAHDPHAWGDLNWCPGSMTSVPPASTASRWCSVHDEPAAECWSNECLTDTPPTQPPSAPETDARSWLDEDDREAIAWALANEGCIHTGAVDPTSITGCRDCQWIADRGIFPAVERIVAERVRVVEGERDAARAALSERSSRNVAMELIHEAEEATARAESAEAAHRALQAAVEALAADFDSNVDWSAGRNNYGDNEAWESAARQARALLAGGAR